jgi:hypothetical protein
MKRDELVPGWEEHVICASIDRGRKKSIKSSCSTTAAMDTTQTRRLLPNLKFRVLVIGRANAGKTSILQRVCETTESPTIYRGNKEVRGPSFCPRVRSYYSGCRQVTLTPTMNVSDTGTFLRLPLNMKLARRALHRRRACVLQSQGLCFSRFPGNRGR